MSEPDKTDPAAGAPPGMQTRSKLGIALAALVTALTPSVIALVNSCDAQRQAEKIGAKTAGVSAMARTADRELDGSYAAIREKMEAAVREAEVCRQMNEALREEIEVERQRIDRLVGRRTERKAPPEAPPPSPELTEPLPATPAAAAAAAQKGGT